MPSTEYSTSPLRRAVMSFLFLFRTLTVNAREFRRIFEKRSGKVAALVLPLIQALDSYVYGKLPRSLHSNYGQARTTSSSSKVHRLCIEEVRQFGHTRSDQRDSGCGGNQNRERRKSWLLIKGSHVCPYH